MGNISSLCQTLNKETISFNRISGTVIYNQVYLTALSRRPEDFTIFSKKIS